MNFRFYLVESKEDRQRFVDKFGQDNLDKFVKLKDRLKNANMSVDMTWYTKNVEKDELEKTFKELEDRVVKDASGATKLNRKKVAENDKYVVWDVLDWETSMNMGEGTVWCITGRYDTNEVKPSQAEHYFNEYKNQGVDTFLFFEPKSGNAEDKYCLVLYKESLGNNPQLWNYKDVPVNGQEVNEKLLAVGSPNFEYAGFKYDWSGKEYITTRYEYDDDTLILLKYVNKSNKHIVIEEPITRIEEEAFKDCEAETIELPNTVKHIASGAFTHCYYLKQIKMPSALQSLGAWAFAACVALESIELPDSLKRIRPFCFKECSHLKSFKMPNQMSRLNAGMFDDCHELESVDLQNISTMGGQAFYGCYNLKDVYINCPIEYWVQMCLETLLNFQDFPIFEDPNHTTVHCSNGDVSMKGWFVLGNDNQTYVLGKEARKYLRY